MTYFTVPTATQTQGAHLCQPSSCPLMEVEGGMCLQVCRAGSDKPALPPAADCILLNSKRKGNEVSRMLQVGQVLLQNTQDVFWALALLTAGIKGAALGSRRFFQLHKCWRSWEGSR